MGMLQVIFLSLVSITSLFVSKTFHCPRVQTHGGVVTMLISLFTLIIGMKYAVVWMKNKKKGKTDEDKGVEGDVDSGVKGQFAYE